MVSLKAKTTKGLFWSFLDSFGVYLIKFGFSIFIARTLSPEDYGLMGMIVIFISLGQMIMQSGFSIALIQRKESRAEDLSTAFWFNVITAFFVYLILFFSAGGIASFFGKPVLVNITRVAALGIILNSLCSVQVSILTKRMDFKRLTWINLASALISGTTGLLMALKGYEVWALVMQTLAGNLIYLAGLWFSSKWKPSLIFDIRSFRSLFSFGYKILLQGLTDVLFTKIYFPVIGKIYSAAQLGFYTNSSRFNELFVRQTANSVNRVIFPAFASIQDDKERFRRNFLRSFNLLASIMFLASMVLIITSRPFIAIALTEKWLPVVPFMQLFLTEGLFFPLLMLNLNILNSTGRSDLSLRVDIIKKALMFISLVLLLKEGIRALIIGQVVSTAIAMVISTVSVSRIHAINFGRIMWSLTRLSLVFVICLLFNYFVIEPINVSDLTELLLKCSIMPALFLAGTWSTGLGTIKQVKYFLHSYRLRSSDK
jgi:teichuronic acid exporter